MYKRGLKSLGTHAHIIKHVVKPKTPIFITQKDDFISKNACSLRVSSFKMAAYKSYRSNHTSSIWGQVYDICC